MSIFRTALFRLTAWYLALIMLLSLVFSIALYRVSTRELSQVENALRENVMRFNLPTGYADLNQQRIDQVVESKRTIAGNLVYFNCIVLITGGAAAFFLAKRTLLPLEESVEAQNRFTADASHELRTPLTAMRTEIEVALRDKKLTLTESKKLHQSTLQEVQKLQTLTNGLLTLSKQDGDALSFQPISLKDVIHAAVGRSEKNAEQHGIALISESTATLFHADPWALEELLTILIDNAIKYSSKGDTVRITGRADRLHVTIAVKDTGTGIKASDLPYIFNRFYRADTSRTKEAIGGYGLGLSIAKKIADAHHGVIDVKSTPGKGSQFLVRLPLK